MDTSLPLSQKAQNRHSPPTRRQTSHPHRSHNPLCSTRPHRSLLSLRSSFSPSKALIPTQPQASAPHSEMPIIITISLRNWLTENGLQGFILVAEAPPHPNATEIASRINIETITDSILRKKLNLDCTSERTSWNAITASIPYLQKRSGLRTSPTLSSETWQNS